MQGQREHAGVFAGTVVMQDSWRLAFFAKRKAQTSGLNVSWMPHFKASGPNPIFLSMDCNVSVNRFAAMRRTRQRNSRVAKVESIGST